MRPKLLGLLFLLGCTRSTELLPPGDDAAPDHPLAADRFVSPDSAVATETGPTRRHYPFCPTTIDVYGGTNFLFPKCGGPQGLIADPKAGLSGSDPGYELTLAGRLAARLEDDPDLTPILGSTWTVRSCAVIGAGLAQLVPPVDADACGRNTPQRDERIQDLCSTNPAPVLLIAASQLDDRCHGGGSDSDAPDDPVTYQNHYRERLNTFLDRRKPRFALVGPRTEWTFASSFFSIPACRWARPEWEQDALSFWKSQSSSGIEAELVGDLNDEFKRHHGCCHELGMDPCGPTWFDRMAFDAVNCDGAYPIVNLWFDALKSWLLSSEFECPDHDIIRPRREI